MPHLSGNEKRPFEYIPHQVQSGFAQEIFEGAIAASG
jgi:hypothetical protein